MPSDKELLSRVVTPSLSPKSEAAYGEAGALKYAATTAPGADPSATFPDLQLD